MMQNLFFWRNKPLMKLIAIILLLSLMGCTRTNRLEAPSKDIVERLLIAEDMVRSAKRLWQIEQKDNERRSALV